MESSEDDAGAAANAPRRSAAREKDNGAEKGNATSSSSMETSEARTWCQTPAMSEENFDGDSVPSPSSHDANTSTEAILDMIDEIVDGPGAPKRLPHSLDANSESAPISDNPELTKVVSEDIAVQISVPCPEPSDKSGQEHDASVSEQTKSTFSPCDTEAPATVAGLADTGSPQSSEPVVESEPADTPVMTESNPDESANTESVSDCPPLNLPTSSEVETEQSVSNVSVCLAQDRTVKCVTSTYDNVTVVGSAESTSSDNSVCDGKVQVHEAPTRSPLRRRLVRPAPSDRRPDSTVSSTSTSDEHTEQSISEIKDVSSSSDAVPATVHGNVNEEIRNVSEISVCKAETSGSPPKKIKLIRQKSSTVGHNVQDKPMLLLEHEQCQSTSAETTEAIISEPCPLVTDSTSATSSDECHAMADHNKEVMHEISIEIPSNECRKEDKQKIEEESSAGQGALILAPESKDVNEEQSAIPTNVGSSSKSLINQSESEASIMIDTSKSKCENVEQEQSESIKQVPKLTIKLSSKQSDEVKSPPVPKLTIKPIKPPVEDKKVENVEQMPSISKLNIKPIPKPPQVNDNSMRSLSKTENRTEKDEEQIPLVTKINIKPIPKPPEKINEVHRKSSSSEISESEYSENDDTSTSDQASASDQGPTDMVPKVTIKLGKPGTQSEGKFYTEKNIPKLTIKGLQNEKEDIRKLTIKNINMHHNEKEDPEKGIPKLTIKGFQHCEKEDSDSSKLKLIISQSEDKQSDKIPKLTIKTVAKAEGQPLSPKLTIKPIKPPSDLSSKEGVSDVQPIPKLKISTEPLSSVVEVKENAHVPKITIKPVTRVDIDSKPPKKSTAVYESPENIPVVTKLNIKPILKPSECEESSESMKEKVPVVSKLNIKPVIKPKDNEINSSLEDIPKITKLNIKPIKCPEGSSSKEKDCDEMKAEVEENSIPVVTKLNIKPIIKPADEETSKDSGNQSSETGNSSDENTDNIPIVTKLNIKPILKPNDLEDVCKLKSSDDQAAIPVVTKLTIKPLVKPEESVSPLSPKKGSDLRISIPVVTKLNIKPVVKPEDDSNQKLKDDVEDNSVKNPPIVMKINMKAVADPSSSERLCVDKKINNVDDTREHIFNNISEELPKTNLKVNLKSSEIYDLERISSGNSKIDRVSDKEENIELEARVADVNIKLDTSLKQNCVPETAEILTNDMSNSNRELPSSSILKIKKTEEIEDKPIIESNTTQEKTQISQVSNSTSLELENSILEKEESTPEDNKINQKTENSSSLVEPPVDTSDVSQIRNLIKQQNRSVQNCTLLKKLLETSDDSLDNRLEPSEEKTNRSSSPSLLCQEPVNCLEKQSDQQSTGNLYSDSIHDRKNRSQSPEVPSDSNVSPAAIKIRTIQEISKEASENLKNPLEINISEKVNQSSGQDSPRIILKINKTDHGASAKIITEDPSKPDTEEQKAEMTNEIINDKESPKRNVVNSKRKHESSVTQSAPVGKRLRSSRIVESMDKSSSLVRRNVGKRQIDQSPLQSNEPELSVLETKRLKLGQLLSNKSLTISPVVVSQETSVNKSVDFKHDNKGKTVNHSLLNNENCSKNGNSKLHNILSNLQANQIQVKPVINDKNETVTLEVDSNISSGSGECDIVRENCHPEVQEMMINESFEFPNFGISADEMSQDPLEVDGSKLNNEEVNIPKAVEMTPQPKKRGRPRKIPLSEGAKPIPAPVVALPVTALEERPQRSLRLSRDRPAIIAKPRGGRGRGRGARRPDAPPSGPSAPDEPEPEPIDPTSSRIKLPRMTEALDKSVCSTPLSSRRLSESGDMKLFGDSQSVSSVMDETSKEDSFMKSPSPSRGGRGARARGSRPGRSPARGARRGGRGRGGGRGAMYMKETLGIYGRVCGPATTTVQLFEEETCMMDDNATPAKPSCLLDEDSQSSVKSSTNESNKLKKSKFADLFDSNKIWTAEDVKEYTWPPPGEGDEESQVMMIEEQVALFLGARSLRRRYPALRRRRVAGAERARLAALLGRAAPADLTAVDASEVLDIMLSDYPHKYEEYRSYQRQRQLTEDDVKEERVDKVEMKAEVKADVKPEPPKVDPEKTRQDMALAAMASASEWNSRMNALRRPACVDLQSLTIQRRLAAPAAPRAHVRPPAGFYPHALLPGQYQHAYRRYTPDQLRYFPLNTALAAPPAPPESSSDSGSDSERDSSADSDVNTYHHLHKRKRLTKVKRSSHEASCSKDIKEESRDGAEVDLCKVCKLRLEANRKYTHERFLVCAECNGKLHPGCVELSADTVRKCREYPWQCADCKTCNACRDSRHDTKMLFCDLCDRGFHSYCVGLDKVPSGRWHCVECAVCRSCGAREPGGAPGAPGTPGAGGAAEWHHQTKRGPGGHKVYSHSLCTPCASKSKRGYVNT
ncbi:uncharacterized protein LOC106140429 isoform X2 [Amyelois transitella]|uniref:uncharacterized protein LOC106140429 isoform X2 n=1 Tax=Amyelois transitella TaxID=680683 RepID=UPI0029902C9C|nr:uncharacterized protein LOC106140429 isoform X2 [Amyelois transitella]XP_060804004.1 uncharacterized protein LOC106140429 isoform X2 [Amyelois transitella]